MKLYKFRYDSQTDKRLGCFLGSMQNLLYPQVYCFLLLFVLHIFDITKPWPGWMSPALLGVSFFIGLILMIRLWCCKKGVIVYDSFFEIARYTTTRTIQKMNIAIPYSEISSIFINHQNLRYTRNFRKLLIPAGARTSYVELTLKSGKQYFFAVENQEDFVKEIKMKIELL